jgi:hypothetical protein
MRYCGKCDTDYYENCNCKQPSSGSEMTEINKGGIPVKNASYWRREYKKLEAQLVESEREKNYWVDVALGHIACEEHTSTHVGGMVACPFCVAEDATKRLETLIEEVTNFCSGAGEKAALNT